MICGTPSRTPAGFARQLRKRPLCQLCHGAKSKCGWGRESSMSRLRAGTFQTFRKNLANKMPSLGGMRHRWSPWSNLKRYVSRAATEVPQRSSKTCACVSESAKSKLCSKLFANIHRAALPESILPLSKAKLVSLARRICKGPRAIRLRASESLAPRGIYGGAGSPN